MNSMSTNPVLFSLGAESLFDSLSNQLSVEKGFLNVRSFPDGESYLQVLSPVKDRACVLLVDFANPNESFLSVVFLCETLKEMGATSVGLVAPYLCYMRQDRRFHEGEAVTSKLFAKLISDHFDWLVTVDPHLHRYHTLDEIYSIPNSVLHGASALSEWVKDQKDCLLVGPDAESEQWVSGIAEYSGHPFIIGSKTRLGDKQVNIELPNFQVNKFTKVIIVDDVISSGFTVLRCFEALKAKHAQDIRCLAVHGIFANGIDSLLIRAGLKDIVTTNTIPHYSNKIDVAPLLADAIDTHLSEVC